MTKRSWILIAGILLLGSVLRFSYLTRHDSYTDEALLAFRAIGMIDYDTSSTQTTPWQWVPTVPWWMHLSFHDHPLLFFLVEHASLKLFGINLFAVRLPAVLSGLAAMALLFAIGKKIGGERVGMIAALVMAVSSYHVWVSRVGIQDGLVICLMLTVLWLCFLAREKPERWVWVGAVAGLGIFAKYTLLILFPLIGLFWGMYRISWQSAGRHLLRGGVAFVAITTPVWLYNLLLYRTFGHFDFQWSAFFGQDVPQWTVRLGRLQVGGFTDRFLNFWRALLYSNSPLFNLGAVSAVVALTVIVWRKKEPVWRWLLGSMVLMWLWFFVIGSTYRFVVMIIPFLTLAIAWGWVRLSEYLKYQPILWYILFAGFVLFEMVFTINTFFVSRSYGKEFVTYGRIQEETKNSGFNELDTYLNQVLEGKVSGLFGAPAYQFLTDQVEKNTATKKARGAESAAILFIYDHNLQFIAKLWTFERRLTYEGWPFIADDVFAATVGTKQEQFYRDQGVEHFYYIHPLTDAALAPPHARRETGTSLVPYLEKKGIVPTIIRNRAGDAAFAVYEF